MVLHTHEYEWFDRRNDADEKLKNIFFFGGIFLFFVFICMAIIFVLSTN